METIQLNLEMTQFFTLIDSLGRAFYDIKGDILKREKGEISRGYKLQLESILGVSCIYKQCLDVAKAEFPKNIADDLIKMADKNILSITEQRFYQGYLDNLKSSHTRRGDIKKKQPEPTN